MSEVQSAVKAEVADAVTKFEFRGVQLEVPSSLEDWTVEALEALEREQVSVFLAELLGSVQWRAVRALKLKVRDLNELTEVCLASLGVDSKN